MGDRRIIGRHFLEEQVMCMSQMSCTGSGLSSALHGLRGVETSGSTVTHTSLMECNVFTKQNYENYTADTTAQIEDTAP
jgi:hypothetical protein